MSKSMLDILKNFNSAEKGEHNASSADKGSMRAILESFNSVDEAPMPVPTAPAAMAPPVEDKGQPVSMNVSLNASGKDHVEDLLGLMKLAGVQGVAGDTKLDIDVDSDNQPDIALMPTEAEQDVEEGSIKYMHRLQSKGHSVEEIAKELDMSPEEVKRAMSKTEEDFANEPEEEYKDTEYMMKDLSGGLNREKKMYAKAQDGDNAMAVESIKEQLLKALAEKKMPMGPGPDGKNGTDDDKPAFLPQNTGDKKSKGKKPKKGGMSAEQEKYFGKKK